MLRTVDPYQMLNIHPALLPAFVGKGMHGDNVHAAVVNSGARFTGPTVHFVNEKFDDGKIVAQRVVPVMPTDTPEVRLLPIRPRSRGERRSLRTSLPGVSRFHSPPTTPFNSTPDAPFN
jgi:hypothetical protein